MKKQFGLIEGNFDDLLEWFSENREEAGRKYEKIRNGLIRFFYFKGCADPEDLADKVINRVTLKLPVLDLSEKTDPTKIFYGFASKISLEYFKALKRREVEFDADLHTAAETEEPLTQSDDLNHECLNECLAKLSDEERNLIIEYYSFDKEEKTEHRKKLAEKFKMKIGTLQVKVYRMRKVLRKCIEKCAAAK